MKIINCFAAITAVIILASCNAPRYIYSPSATNTAMASGAGDGQLTAAASVAGNGAGINLSGNYALGKFFGVGAQYYYAGDHNDGTLGLIGSSGEQRTELNYRRRMATAQLFFYGPFNNAKTFFGEMAVGYGAGKYHINDAQTTNNGTGVTTRENFVHDAQATHTTAHAGFYGLLGKQKNARMGVALRFNSIRFHDINTTYTTVQQQAYHLDSLTYKAINFLEPTMNFRFGFDTVPGFEVTMQIGFSTKVNGPEINYRRTHVSVGVGYAFGRKPKK